MGSPVLSGIRVLDLSDYIAGPYCTKLLAELGAEVIKVERPGVGDETRHWDPFFHDKPDLEGGGLFLYLNTGKKSITLNPETPAGRDLLLELVKVSDILVESYAPGLMEGWGRGYSYLSEANPGLVMTSVTHFGQTGPYKEYKASDINYFAFGGLMSVFGDADRPPTKLFDGVVQYWAGGHAFAGTIAALLCKEIAGWGQQVDVSMVESVAHHVNTNYLQYLFKGESAQRNGNRSLGAGGAPSLYSAENGYIQAMLRPFESLVDLLGSPQLLDDPKFSTTAERVAHGAELGEIVQKFMGERSKEEIFRESQKRRLPWAPLNTIADLLSSDHLRIEGFFQEIEHPKAGRLLYPGSPFNMGDRRMVYDRAPLLGEHNEEIYCGMLRLSEQRLAQLREENTV